MGDNDEQQVRTRTQRQVVKWPQRSVCCDIDAGFRDKAVRRPCPRLSEEGPVHGTRQAAARHASQPAADPREEPVSGRRIAFNAERRSMHDAQVCEQRTVCCSALAAINLPRCCTQ